jgi:hypothetical protein
MHVPNALIATLAVMVGATYASTAKSTFYFTEGNPGCVVSVTSECNLGCSSIVILDEEKGCHELTESITRPACTGKVTIDFTATPVVAQFVEDKCSAECIIDDDTCTTPA